MITRTEGEYFPYFLAVFPHLRSTGGSQSRLAEKTRVVCVLSAGNAPASSDTVLTSAILNEAASQPMTGRDLISSVFDLRSECRWCRGRDDVTPSLWNTPLQH